MYINMTYVGGRYCHQTSTLFTIITKQIHHRQTTKKKRRDRKGQSLHGNIQKRRNKKIKIIMTYTQKNISTKKKQKKNNKKTNKNIHSNNKLRNLHTFINIHPTQTHVIAEPFDSSVRMKKFNLCFHQ